MIRDPTLKRGLSVLSCVGTVVFAAVLLLFCTKKTDDTTPIDAENIRFEAEAEVVASEDEPYTYLINPADNDVCMEYQVYLSSGELLFTTDRLQPGEAFRWDVYHDTSLPDGPCEYRYMIWSYADTKSQDVIDSTSIDGITIEKEK